MEYGKVTDRELGSIRKIVGLERMSVGESVLDLHSEDESFHRKHKPDLVVWPLSAEEISQILNLADENRIPLLHGGRDESGESLLVMRPIKELLDPNRIMNPGKIFD
jgi:D-lactate dehydrogenase (cytochrome)